MIAVALKSTYTFRTGTVAQVIFVRGFKMLRMFAQTILYFTNSENSMKHFVKQNIFKRVDSTSGE